MMGLFSTGCTVGGDDAAVCAGTAADRSAHARALAEDGGPVSRRSGAVLIGKIDGACAWPGP